MENQPESKALPYRERLYCVEMMLKEMEKLAYVGETRRYLSLDDNDNIVLVEALKAYRTILRDSPQ